MFLMMEGEKVRVDKWLWAVRIFKTRSLAAEECNKGHVTIKQLTDKRMSAQLAVNFVEDVTPPESLALLNSVKAYGFEFRPRGLGRPTKRDRRMIDKLKGGEEED